MLLRLPELRDFAARYTDAWCSQDLESVAAFFWPDGSVRVSEWSSSGQAERGCPSDAVVHDRILGSFGDDE
jgi:hypothetical protein